MVKELRSIVRDNPKYPAVLFFCQGTVKQSEEFFDDFWPEARAVSDTERFFYQAFGLGQASVLQMFGPTPFVRGVQSLLKGNLGGKFIGDIWMMPGVFVVKNESIIWQHDFQHVGDHPDFTSIPEQIKNLNK